MFDVNRNVINVSNVKCMLNLLIFFFYKNYKQKNKDYSFRLRILIPKNK